jgi:hypothetical protein
MPVLVAHALQESIASMAIPDASPLNVVDEIHGVRPDRDLRPTCPTRSTAFLQTLPPEPSPLHLCLPLDPAAKQSDWVTRSVFWRSRNLGILYAFALFSLSLSLGLSATSSGPESVFSAFTYLNL